MIIDLFELDFLNANLLELKIMSYRTEIDKFILRLYSSSTES